jgi:HAD superfamily hydrolase (TIGR01509 family)
VTTFATDAPPAAVLWDMDGTIVDTDPYWIAAEHALVERYGGRWSEEHAHAIVGSDLLTGAEYIRAHSPVKLSAPEIVDELMSAVIAGVRREVTWRPGARELLEETLATGVPNALVTMSWQPLAQAVADALPGSPFAVLVTGDQVSRGKPHPDPYLRAAELLGVSPQDCVAIEDSPTGARSASAAGVPTVAVRHLVPVPDLPGVVEIPTLAGVDLKELTRLAAAASVVAR